MADLSKIKLNGTTYNFKDTEARNAINNFEETDPTVPAWAKAANKPTYTAAEVGALPSTYTAPVTSVNGQTGAVSLTIPTVPTNVSSFTNDSGYLTLATLPIYDGTVQNG